jgi:hypothetical protein
MATAPNALAQMSGHGGAVSNEVALGLTHFGTPPSPSIQYPNPREAIEVFGKRRNAVTYYQWRNEGLTPTTDFRFDFELAFGEAMQLAGNVHFKLDGFDLRRAWQLGQNADPYAAGVTNWEFVRVLLDRDVREKTSFWQNGKQVSLDFVLNRAGVSPNALP